MRQPLFLIFVALGVQFVRGNPPSAGQVVDFESLVRGIPSSAGQHDDRVQHHTHEGSIGNLCNDRIRKKMEAVIGGFHFETVLEAEERLSIPRP